MLEHLEDQLVHAIGVSAARLGGHLGIEVAALRIEVLELLDQVAWRAIRLIFQVERAGEGGRVVALVALEARLEERPRLDAHPQRDLPLPHDDVVRDVCAVVAAGAEQRLELHVGGVEVRIVGALVAGDGVLTGRELLQVLGLDVGDVKYTLHQQARDPGLHVHEDQHALPVVGSARGDLHLGARVAVAHEQGDELGALLGDVHAEQLAPVGEVRLAGDLVLVHAAAAVRVDGQGLDDLAGDDVDHQAHARPIALDRHAPAGERAGAHDLRQGATGDGCRERLRRLHLRQDGDANVRPGVVVEHDLDLDDRTTGEAADVRRRREARVRRLRACRAERRADEREGQHE